MSVILLAGSIGSAEEVDMVTAASPAATLDGSNFWLHGGSPADGTLPWADELGLTGQQRTDIQIVLADYAPRLGDLVKLARDTAKNLLATPPDAPEYGDQTQEAGAIAASSAAEVVVLLAEMRGKLYALLTPEQREKLPELIASIRASRSTHHPADDSTAAP